MKRLDPSLDAAKRKAAERAVAEVEDEMVLGLGSGTTAAMALECLARRIAGGLEVRGIPTSKATAKLARHLGIPLTDFDRDRRIDLTIDGADQIEQGTLNLIKGLGGALLREKIVAAVSSRVIIIADHTKLVPNLGSDTPVPVEIVAFGWQTVMERLQDLGCACDLRRDFGGTVFATDGGNYIADCSFETIPDAFDLEARLSNTIGVVESGLFIGMASQVVLGSSDAVQVIEKSCE